MVLRPGASRLRSEFRTSEVSWPSAKVLASGCDLKLGTPVLGKRRLVVALRDRPLFTIRDRLQAGLRNAMVDEIALDGRRAALAEREVVLVRPAFVGVPLNLDHHAGIRLKNRDLRVENRSIFRPKIRLIIGEVNRCGQRGPRGTGISHGSLGGRDAVRAAPIGVFSATPRVLFLGATNTVGVWSRHGGRRGRRPGAHRGL